MTLTETDNEIKNPYVLNFVLNSDNFKINMEQSNELKIQLAEFDCKINYFVFSIDENNNRTKEIRNSIKVRVFSDIDINITQ